MSNIRQSEISFWGRFYDLLLKEKSLLLEILSIEQDKSLAFGKSKSFIDLDYYNEGLKLLVDGQKSLEERRLAYLKELSIIKARKLRSLKDILPYIPDELKAKYLDIEKALNSVIDEIRLVNRSNEVIIQDSLKLIGYGLSMFREEQELEINYKERDKSSIRYKPIIINTVI